MDTSGKYYQMKRRYPVLVVVDDEEEILNSLRSLFRRSGYSLNFFTSAKMALEFIRENKTDVIISDMRMPEMSGTEFLEKSLEFSPDSVKIIISGYEEKSVILGAISNCLARHYIMKPWDDKELQSLVAESIDFIDNLHKRHLEELFKKNKNLPAPPILHQHLIVILRKSNQSQKEIAAEIEKSPALVAKLLRVSNSIFYGSRKEISTIYDAITFIGTETILSMVLGLETFNNLYAEVDEDVIQKSEELRLISVSRAHLAREIAQRWPTNVNQHQAYIAALLLDIGLVFRFTADREKMNQYFELCEENNTHSFSADKKMYHVTHDQVGEYLLRYWNFASPIINAVANHHSQTHSDPLTIIVQLADYFVQGKNALPHDPIIEQQRNEWENKLTDVLKNPIISDLI